MSARNEQKTILDFFGGNKKRKLSASGEAHIVVVNEVVAPSALHSDTVISASQSVSALATARPCISQDSIANSRPLCYSFGSNATSTFTFTLPSEATNGSAQQRLARLATLLRSEVGADLRTAIADQLSEIADSLSSTPRAPMPPTLHKPSRFSAASQNDVLLPVLQRIEERFSVLEHNMRSIKNAVNTSRSEKPNSTPLPNVYPNVNQNARPKNCSIDCLTIVPNANHEVVAKARQTLLDNERLKAGEIGVDFFNVHPSGNVFIHCRSPENAESVAGILSATGMSVRGVKKRKPRFLISSLPTDIVESDFLKWIESSDSKFAAHKGSTTFLRKLKLDAARCALLIEVTENLATLLQSNPSVNYLLRTCKIKKFLDLLQCKHCSRYGHTMKCCRFKHLKPSCTTCAGSGCGTASCRVATVRKCANCERLGLAADHASWDKVCPHRRERIRCLS